jgi:hypothetical protein
MQKLINLMAVSSFVVSLGVVAGGVYVTQNKDKIADNIKEKVASSIAEALPGMIAGATMGSDLAPELPTPPKFGPGF